MRFFHFAAFARAADTGGQVYDGLEKFLPTSKTDSDLIESSLEGFTMIEFARTSRLMGTAAVLCFFGASLAARGAAPVPPHAQTPADGRYEVYVSGIT